MRSLAARVIFCLDHTKFARKSVAFLCELDRIHTVVTDSMAPAELVDDLRAKGLDVIVAPGEGQPVEKTVGDADELGGEQSADSGPMVSSGSWTALD